MGHEPIIAPMRPANDSEKASWGHPRLLADLRLPRMQHSKDHSRLLRTLLFRSVQYSLSMICHNLNIIRGLAWRGEGPVHLFLYSHAVETESWGASHGCSALARKNGGSCSFGRGVAVVHRHDFIDAGALLCQDIGRTEFTLSMRAQPPGAWPSLSSNFTGNADAYTFRWGDECPPSQISHHLLAS
jgi:hypothetical protein